MMNPVKVDNALKHPKANLQNNSCHLYKLSCTIVLIEKDNRNIYLKYFM